MTVMTTAGSSLAISAGVPATQDAAGYNALTYTVGGEITDLGNLGKTYATVTHNPVASRRVQKIKGSYNNGTMTVKMGRDFSDAGQTLFTTARDSDASFAFRLTLQNGKKLYFQGLVSSFTYEVGTVDQITAGTVTIELQTDIVEV
jgi:hypothetical protein